MAKKIINQIVDIIGQLGLGSKKIEKQICSDFVFSKCQMLISKKITKPICSHFQCSVLISKKITEPICNDLVFKKCPFSFGPENYKPNSRLCRRLGAGLVLVSKKTEKTILYIISFYNLLHTDWYRFIMIYIIIYYIYRIIYTYIYIYRII